MGTLKIIRERGDYRMRRAWPGYVVERRWDNGWTRIGGTMSRHNAWAVLFECSDWQILTTPEQNALMRAVTPSVSRPGR